MTHHLARVLAPAIFGAPVWLCACGHRAWSTADWDDHIDHHNRETT